MNISKLLTEIDNQTKQLRQIQSLFHFLESTGELPTHSKTDLIACLSIIRDLANKAINQQEIISHDVSELVIVSNCVAGNG